MEENDNILNKEDRIVKFALLILLITVILSVVLVIIKNYFKLYFDFTELALLGDYLGGLLGGILAISTVFLIYATYKTQQKELAATNKQLLETVKQAIITNETMLKQQFETTFFNMINMHSNLINDLKYGEFRGREALINFYEQVNEQYYYHLFNQHIENLFYDCEDNLEEIYKEVKMIRKSILMNPPAMDYKNFQYNVKNLNREVSRNTTGLSIIGIDKEMSQQLLIKGNLANNLINSYKDEQNNKAYALKLANIQSKYFLSNYIKSVRTIIRYIDLAKNIQNKQDYLNIFFSQFTIHEITILYYFMELGNEKEMKKYFDKYSNLNTKDILQDAMLSR
ncbi:putative phage abortive infection protein [Caryophanon tenue]|uniref:Phage abortive infection protein n=1 Tax=Caryophanon tenue TaxID=33978 RepID=A0A1C0Y507_9BACL|nr:putative phage abortive infection protein [Caryophanon tenue]OCS82269.1 hypothetical protein A6M13_07485 [Caryophanon tenue]